MAESPQTIATIFALKSCDPSYKNVMYFPNNVSIKDRLSKISVAPAKSYIELQYIRENSYVELPIIYDRAHDYNYIVYNNGEGEGDVYAFITAVEFLNFENTRFYIKKDVWTNYYRTANKIALIDRIHSTAISTIPDIIIQPQMQNGMILCEPSSYYFGLQIVYDELENFLENYKTAETMHLIFKYTGTTNTVEPYGDETVDLIQNLFKLAIVHSVSLYYIPDNMLPKYTFKQFKLPKEGNQGLNIKAYKLYRNAPVDTASTFTRTITLSAPYSQSKKLLNRYPYATRTIFTAGGTVDVNPLKFTGAINVKTSYFDGVDGMHFRHELSPASSPAERCILYEDSVSIPLVKDSYQEYILSNISGALKGIVGGIIGLSIGGIGASIGLNYAKDLYTAPGSKMSMEAYQSYAYNAVSPHIRQAANTLTSLPMSMIEGAFLPNKVPSISGGEQSMLYMLPGMFAYYDTKLYSEQEDYCMDTWNTTGQKFLKVITMNYSVGKYYTYIKTQAYDSNIYNAEDATEFESILMNGTTIWNMTSETDYKLYGHYVSYEENILS